MNAEHNDPRHIKSSELAEEIMHKIRDTDAYKGAVVLLVANKDLDIATNGMARSGSLEALVEGFVGAMENDESMSTVSIIASSFASYLAGTRYENFATVFTAFLAGLEKAIEANLQDRPCPHFEAMLHGLRRMRIEKTINPN
jgi:cell division protein FtsW (lipid II flippase)